MRYRISALILAIVAACPLHAAHAAPDRDTTSKIAPSAKLPPPMEIFHVRSAAPGCEPNCPEWIAAQGTIRPGTVAKLKIVLSRTGKSRLPILMDSPGGDVAESLALGRLIRAKGIVLVVSKTEMKACSATDTACKRLKASGVHLGTPNAYLAVCASACAFTLAGGERRIVGRTSFVGVHEVASYKTTVRLLQRYRITQSEIFGVPTGKKTKTLISSKKVSEKTEEVKTSEAEYKKLAAYFAEMGIGAEINSLLRKAPHSSIHVLTRAELDITRLATDAADVDDVIKTAAVAREIAADKPKDEVKVSSSTCNQKSAGKTACRTERTTSRNRRTAKN